MSSNSPGASKGERPMDQQGPPRRELTWRRPVLYMLWKWRQRHQQPFNFAIHLVGIPLAVVGVWLLVTEPWDEWYWGVGAFVAGYLLQYVGHRVEGNDIGEWAFVKQLLGLPHMPIAPAPSSTAKDQEQKELT